MTPRWHDKIARNIELDAEVGRALEAAGPAVEVTGWRGVVERGLDAIGEVSAPARARAEIATKEAEEDDLDEWVADLLG
ncbi:MAG: hypothetical protein Q8P41_18525 [Pseudomonadota bacterium]|nr:hypothetical protein [Pseudomonadota bacterium]